MNGALINSYTPFGLALVTDSKGKCIDVTVSSSMLLVCAVFLVDYADVESYLRSKDLASAHVLRTIIFLEFILSFGYPILSCTKISISIFTPGGVSVVVWGGGATAFIRPQVPNRTYWEKHSQSFSKRERKQL
ncbi:hypothetical protein NPIL_627301 [Nephila pilipes]|uniref:Uncharacterized protein n=1 Tax=Nephila pilipes TaxID=299642 RepID=A0A8X6N5V6_NEPPI|nr:hypothetical protein NPIL_627301 [Nephila pilipes]